jgi:Cof subfamily protein (haloacid dehalogenase superfamily)
MEIGRFGNFRDHHHFSEPTCTTYMSNSHPDPIEIKIIFFDVDGTLLGSDHKLHTRTLTSLTRLRQEHPEIPLVIASGKQYNSCKWIRDAIGFPTRYPSIHCNGALIYGGDSGSLIRSHGLDGETIKYIVERTKRFGTFIFNEDEALLVNRGQGINDKDWCDIAGRYDKGVSDRTSEADYAAALHAASEGSFPVAKVTICADESDLIGASYNTAVCRTTSCWLNISNDPESAAELAVLERDAPHPFRITRAIPFIFEAIPSGIGKSTAVVEVCNLLGIDPANAMAFGDGDNDVDMFKVVGHSVAMANGMSNARATARYLTSSNDEGGVGEFVDRIWKFS